jgi:hypothetical protein
MKRIAIFLGSILIVAVAAYFYFSPRDFSFFEESSAYHAVPLDAPLFFEINSVRSIPLANAMFQELKETNLWQSFFSLSERFDSLVSKSTEVPSGLRNDKLLIAIKYEGRDEITPLFIIPSTGSSKRKGWTALIDTWYPDAEFSRNERNYDQFSVIDIANNQNRSVFSYAYAEGMMLASPKSVLVEQALRQLTSTGISDNPGFVKVNRKTSGQSHAVLYINHRFFPGFLSRWLNNDIFRQVNEFGETEISRYARDINVFRTYANWSELDIQINDNGLRMNGVTSASDSLNNFLTVFAKQQPQRFQADKLLPDNTCFFVSYSFSDSHDFFSRLENYFRAHNKFYYREEKFTRMASETRTNVKNLFQNILENEIILAYTSIPPDPTGKSGLIIIPSRNRAAAEGQILQMLRIRAERNGQLLNDQSVTIDANKRWYAYKFPYPSLPGLWLGQPFRSIKANYIAFWENNIVMANSENEIASYFRKMDQGETLSKNSGYQQFMRSADSRACINVFFDIARGFNMGSEILDATLFRKINGKQEHLKKFRYANWQMINSKEISNNILMLSYSNVPGERVASSGHASMEARAATRPQLVVNHTNRNQREIILQDEKNKVYLISAEGIILWGLDVKSRILGEIHQVDMLKNGNLQFLFNTRDKIYLLDRNGNDLAPFPLSLPSDATNGIAVFDYDRTRDYRIFVATNNKKVLLYDMNGKLVDGWKFEGTKSEVTTPIQYFRISGRDHIVFKDKTNVYIVDRQGTPRISHDGKLEHSSNPLVYEAIGSPKIIGTDSRGLVHFFFFDGKHETVNAGSYSSRHFFTAGDLDGNGKFNFVFADGDQLTVTDRTGKRLFTERIRQGISYMPEIVNTGNKSRKVGVVSAGNNRIFLFNHDGSQYPGFPVTGSSPFTVGKLAENKSQFHLIASDSRGQLLTIPLN